MKHNYTQFTRKDNSTHKSLPNKTGLSIGYLVVIVIIIQGYLALFLQLAIQKEINRQYKLKEVNALTLSTEEIDKQIKDFDMKFFGIHKEKNLLLSFKMKLNERLSISKNTSNLMRNKISNSKRYKELSLTMTVILNQKDIEKVEEYSKCKFHSNCYRMSRDGYNAQTFHGKCDGLKPTVTIIKLNPNEMIGGFTTESWEGKELKYDAKAFLFSVVKDKIFYIRENMPAINTSPELLPTFGASDIYLSNTESFTRTVLLSYAFNIEDSKDNSKGEYLKLEPMDIEVFKMNCD